jgi:hypothetical protein
VFQGGLINKYKHGTNHAQNSVTKILGKNEGRMKNTVKYGTLREIVGSKRELYKIRQWKVTA